MAAKWYVRWTALDYEDLLQETYTRAFAGTRRCPRHVDVLKFLDETMRSIRGDWVEQWNREHGAISGTAKKYGEEIFNADPRSSELNPELYTLFHDVASLFGQDLEAERIYAGMLAGLRGAELQLHSGIANKTHYESKRKFVRRRLDQYFSESNIPPRWKRHEQKVPDAE
jgi:DNA-directed RNA polymerase specialized sigma24 family protein